MLALQQDARAGILRSIPVTDYVAATSVGVVGGMPMLDLAYEEDSRADVDMNIVKTGDGRFIECRAPPKGRPFERKALDDLMELATRASAARGIQRSIVGGPEVSGRERERAEGPRRHDQSQARSARSRHPRRAPPDRRSSRWRASRTSWNPRKPGRRSPRTPD